MQAKRFKNNRRNGTLRILSIAMTATRALSFLPLSRQGALLAATPDYFSSTALFEKSDKIIKQNNNMFISDGTIPANLRRKIDAKRPTLGHVVPKDARDAIKRSDRQQATGGSKAPRLRQQGKLQQDMFTPSMLKIAGGSARGRRLDSPTVYLRPMMGKVREALYSTLTSFGVYDSLSNHLDIFAGSGSVGLESLSRGATSCTFVDLAADCCACIERNLDKCNLEGTVVQADALQALNEPVSVGIPEGTVFQIVTICPPYEEVVYGDLIEAVVNSPVVTDDTIIVLEYPVELGCLPHVVRREDGGAVVGIRNRRYGRTVIAMYIVNPTGKFELASSRPEEFIKVK
jgi:16S rRNA (guanine(966)-N(2))-methyltransferase RsmD